MKTVNPHPRHMLYKFLDEATGLFWNGSLKWVSLKERATAVQDCFNEVGIEYRSEKASNEAFRNYEVTRVGKPDMNLPVLTKMTYRVELIELNREPFTADPADMRLTHFAMEHHKDSRLTQFVRQLHDHKDIMSYRAIVQRNPNAEVDISSLNGAKISSRKSGKKFIAVRTDADMLYLRMALGENYAGAFDMDTALPI